MYTIDIDIGGTFTDGFFSDGVAYRTCKTLSTPYDITEGFMNCVRLGGAAFGAADGSFLRDASIVRLSTTVGTNLLVQKTGARIGLIVTQGYEETLYGHGPAPIIGKFVARDMVRGVKEEVSETGRVVTPIEGELLLDSVRDLLRVGARMIVLSFANAARNPENEQEARRIVRERYPPHYLRSVSMQIGTEVVAVSDDHARTNSALLNAYIHSDMARRLYRCEDQLRESGFKFPLLIVHANGGNARISKTVALNTLHSGPAAAVKGTVALAKTLGIKDVVSADMGGTSLDIAVIRNGELPITETSNADGVDLAAPLIKLHAVSGGGGSIANVENAALQVGPASAGALPGPACYGKGGLEATVTDANLLLGLIDPDFFLGGAMKLMPKLAERAVARGVGQALGLDTVAAALQIRNIVNAQIASDIRAQLGDEDPSRFAFFALGGCGPLHACAIAEAIGFRTIVVSPFASVFSAFGSSTTDIRHVYSHSFRGDGGSVEAVQQVCAHLHRQAIIELTGEGFAADEIEMALELRLSDGRSEIRNGVSVLNPVFSNLDQLGNMTVERVDLTAQCAVPHWQPSQMEPNGQGAPHARGMRQVVWDDGTRRPTPIFALEAVGAGQGIEGPALIEAADTVIAVNPGWGLNRESYGNFILTR